MQDLVYYNRYPDNPAVHLFGQHIPLPAGGKDLVLPVDMPGIGDEIHIPRNIKLPFMLEKPLSLNLRKLEEPFSLSVGQISTRKLLHAIGGDALDDAASSVDRFAFYMGWDFLVDGGVSVARNEAIRQVLCTGRRGPPLAATAKALAIYSIYKIIYDPIRYYMRKQITGI